MARKSEYCISCRMWGRDVKRLFIRVSIKQEARRANSWQHKFKQRAKPIGWICLACGAMFTDEQAEKCYLKAHGSRQWDKKTGEPIQGKQKVKPIKGLADLIWEINYGKW